LINNGRAKFETNDKNVIEMLNILCEKSSEFKLDKIGRRGHYYIVPMIKIPTDHLEITKCFLEQFKNLKGE
jgi:hypothetical protein